MTTAHAADIPIEYTPPVALPVVYDWTGVYIGVNAGYGWGDFGFGSGSADFPIGFEFGGEAFEGRFGLPNFSADANGWLGGLQIGGNWQVNQIVLGLEADFQWTGMDTGTTIWTGDVADFPNLDAPDFDEFDVSTSAELEWFGTVRGRIGYAMDRWLIYGTGGLAYGRGETTISIAGIDGNDTLGTVSASDNQGHIGWTLGAGVEAAITDNLTFKAEYLYVDLGSETYQFNFRGGASATQDVDFDAHIVRAGLNWRFNNLFGL